MDLCSITGSNVHSDAILGATNGLVLIGAVTVAIWLAGGIPALYVTVGNSNLQWFDNAGIYMETNSSLSELTATIIGNGLTGSYPNSVGIELFQGQTSNREQQLD